MCLGHAPLFSRLGILGWFHLQYLIALIMEVSESNVPVEPESWKNDFLSILMLTLGPLLWLLLVTQLRFSVGWLAFVCQAQIGFYLWLTVLAYGHKRAAQWTWWGVGITAILSLWSLIVALF